MDESFWLQKWERNEIAFHEREANQALVKYFHKLPLAKGGRVFVPLCGKTLDIAWLLSRGCRVAGVELSEKAIMELFADLGVKPERFPSGKMVRYSGNDIDIFCGNIFDATADMLGPIHAVYDRAALVALPQDVRGRYTSHLVRITANAPQLLVSYEYDQPLMDGPPFSVCDEEVRRHYEGRYHVTPLESIDIPGGLKRKCPAKENIWLLQKKNG